LRKTAGYLKENEDKQTYLHEKTPEAKTSARPYGFYILLFYDGNVIYFSEQLII